MNGKIKTAIITGEHAYDVTAFYALFGALDEIDPYIQNMWDFVSDSGKGRTQYDVLLFYNWHQTTPGAGGDAFGLQMKDALEHLGQDDQGIFLLHHALVAFPDWSFWTDLSGMPRRRDVRAAVDQSVRFQIADAEHPITRAIDPWDMIDEIYIASDTIDSSHVLITTDHPQSMTTIAWTRQYQHARVFGYQSGHDDQAFSNPGYRRVIVRGIQWLAGRI